MYYLVIILPTTVSLAASGFMTTSSTLLIDLYPGKEASVTACINFVRCIFAAAAAAYINPAIEGIGMGFTFQIIGIVLGFHNFCIPVLIKFGPKWRQNRIQPETQFKDGDSLRS
jgi:MFS family permease